MVAVVQLVALDTKDRDAIAAFLARQMDAQITKALAGEVLVTPIPTPSPTPVLSPEQMALQAGFDLKKMVPTPEDPVLAGSKIEAEGFLTDPNVVASYERSFIPTTPPVFTVGSSLVIRVLTSVQLHGTIAEAQGTVAVDPSAKAADFAQQFGIDAENVVGQPLDKVPQIADASGGFTLNIKTRQVELDAVFLLFSRGQVSAQVVAIGPALLVNAEDVAKLGQLVDQRIQASSPP